MVWFKVGWFAEGPCPTLVYLGKIPSQSEFSFNSLKNVNYIQEREKEDSGHCVRRGPFLTETSLTIMAFCGRVSVLFVCV